MKEQCNVICNGTVMPARVGTLLSDILGMEKPCGGHGRCGKCKVVARGQLSAITQAERQLLSPDEQAQHVRLACMTYVLGDASLLGTFATANNIPMIIGLLAAPFVIKKMGGMYKINLWGYAFATLCRGLVIVAAYIQSIPLMLLFTALANIGMSPMQGDLNALIVCCSEHTYLAHGKRIDGTMFSCTSLGVKLGGGIGTALSGWLLAAGGYINAAAVQPQSAIDMLHFMYLWLPMILSLLITLLLSRLNVEAANKKLMEAASSDQ